MSANSMTNYDKISMDLHLLRFKKTNANTSFQMTHITLMSDELLDILPLNIKLLLTSFR